MLKNFESELATIDSRVDVIFEGAEV